MNKKGEILRWVEIKKEMVELEEEIAEENGGERQMLWNFFKKLGYCPYNDSEDELTHDNCVLMPTPEAKKEDLLYIIENFPIFTYEINFFPPESASNDSPIVNKEVLESVLKQDELICIYGEIDWVMEILDITEGEMKREMIKLGIEVWRNVSRELFLGQSWEEKTTKALKSIIKKRREK